MRPKERRDSGQKDFFRARLDQIVDMAHPLCKLAAPSIGVFSRQRFGAGYSDAAGHPPLPTRLMAGRAVLKHMHNLSDEALCRSSLMRWRSGSSTSGLERQLVLEELFAAKQLEIWVFQPARSAHCFDRNKS